MKTIITTSLLIFFFVAVMLQRIVAKKQTTNDSVRIPLELVNDELEYGVILSIPVLVLGWPLVLLPRNYQFNLI
jgi:hypothetical protein